MVTGTVLILPRGVCLCVYMYVCMYIIYLISISIYIYIIYIISISIYLSIYLSISITAIIAVIVEQLSLGTNY